MYFTLYLPGVMCVCVGLERCITGVHQHPQPALHVKGHVQGTVGQGQPAVWYQLLFTLLVQSKKLNYGHPEDTQETSNWSAKTPGSSMVVLGDQGCVPAPIQPYYLVRQKKFPYVPIHSMSNAVSQINQDDLLHLSHFAVCKPACFFGYFDPQSFRQQKSRQIYWATERA